MDKITVKILNPSAIEDAKKTMVFAARLTQRGHKLKSMEDVITLYNKPYESKTVNNLISLNHTTLQKFGVINIVICGCSRRFLTQITRHQNEVKFMSTSLQYSIFNNYDENSFVVPYNLLDDEEGRTKYIQSCMESMTNYIDIANSIGNDDASYASPQGLRQVLLISATPYQWKHMISQRVCHRNSIETRYIMLRIWHELCKIDNDMFWDAGPVCYYKGCDQGDMACKKAPSLGGPDWILYDEFSKIKDCYL